MTSTTAPGGVAARLLQWVQARPWVDAARLSPRQLQQASRELQVGLTELLRAREELVRLSAAQAEEAGRSFQTMREAAGRGRADRGGRAFGASPAMARFGEPGGEGRGAGKLGLSLQDAHAVMRHGVGRGHGGEPPG